jgi:hypothetical protein
MKNTLLVIVVLLVGCATTPTVKSVAGTYGWKEDGNTIKLVFLENGKVEHYGNEEGREWKIDEK